MFRFYKKTIIALVLVTCSAGAATAQHVDVYTAGYSGNRAVVWKNDVATNLTDGSQSAVAYSVVVSGSDVYVAGNAGNVAVVWKNDVATNLTDGTQSAAARSVFVSGEDVYVAGNEGNMAVVWKNGVATNLTDGTLPAVANSVFVSGGDVYVAGHADNVATSWEDNKAVIWKNGIQSDLSTTDRSTATSVFVQGNNVYVAGNDYGTSQSKVKIWKNGVSSVLPHSGNAYTESTCANAVYVSGSDVYVAGTLLIGYTAGGIALYDAKVWKNGSLLYNELEYSGPLINDNKDGEARSIFVYGKDIYIAGCTKKERSSSSEKRAGYWNCREEDKANNIPAVRQWNSLGAASESRANSIFVVGNSTSRISDIPANENATVVAYYSITGQKLGKEPETGLYIIQYDNGKAEKVFKNK